MLRRYQGRWVWTTRKPQIVHGLGDTGWLKMPKRAVWYRAYGEPFKTYEVAIAELRREGLACHPGESPDACRARRELRHGPDPAYHANLKLP